jgi:uncharacterized iron-regulated membrane protein
VKEENADFFRVVLMGHFYLWLPTEIGQLLRMNYDIHTGAVIGLPGKILAFFASLIAASLPVTGFYIRWGRRKQSKEKEKERVSILPLSVQSES